MATSKKKRATEKKPPEAPADPAPEAEEAAAPEPAPEPEPERWARDTDKRPDDEEKAIRAALKKAEKALESVEETIMRFEPGPEEPIRTAFATLAKELDGLKPPEPRKCKEYKRALALARKGEMGIHPDDVMKYCRCEECHALRDKAGIPHPPPPRLA